MKALIFLSVLAILNTGCAKDISDQRPYTPPGYSGDGLEVGTLSEVHSMLIYKDNMLVFEAYFTGHKYKWDAPGYHGDIVNWDRETPHRIMSGEILRNASGLNLDAFSMKYLFGPLDVDYPLWTQFENGLIDAGGSLRLTPREMLKFGVTYLNGGEWNGEQLIPSEWVEKSALAFNNNNGINIPIEDTGKNGYGYSWWTNELSHSGEKTMCFRAGGWGGQSIMVFPELDMVIVFTGGNYAVRSSLHKIVERFILPAINL